MNIKKILLVIVFFIFIYRIFGYIFNYFYLKKLRNIIKIENEDGKACVYFTSENNFAKCNNIQFKNNFINSICPTPRTSCEGFTFQGQLLNDSTLYSLKYRIFISTWNYAVESILYITVIITLI